MRNFNKTEIVYSILILTIPLVILFTTYAMSKDNADKQNALVEKEQKEFNQEINVFNEVEILAKAAVVKDINTGQILYAKNPDISLPLASITKVLTVLTVDKLANRDIVRIDLDDLSTKGDSNLVEGENFNIQDLIDLTLAISSNDGAAALSSSVINSIESSRPIDFIEEMNILAQHIGMNRSRFYNVTGLDENEKRAGAYGSAEDIAKLFEYTVKNNKKLLESTTKKEISVKSLGGLIHNASNTNDIIDELPNIIASKTGYTDIAGGNLAVVIDPFLNKPIIIVVLGSSEMGRFEDVNKLAEKTVEYFKNKQ